MLKIRRKIKIFIFPEFDLLLRSRIPGLGRSHQFFLIIICDCCFCLLYLIIMSILQRKTRDLNMYKLVIKGSSLEKNETAGALIVTSFWFWRLMHRYGAVFNNSLPKRINSMLISPRNSVLDITYFYMTSPIKALCGWYQLILRTVISPGRYINLPDITKQLCP